MHAIHAMHAMHAPPTGLAREVGQVPLPLPQSVTEGTGHNKENQNALVDAAVCYVFCFFSSGEGFFAISTERAIFGGGGNKIIFWDKAFIIFLRG